MDLNGTSLEFWGCMKLVVKNLVACESGRWFIPQSS
jgi:hypothetical protein